MKQLLKILGILLTLSYSSSAQYSAMTEDSLDIMKYGTATTTEAKPSIKSTRILGPANTTFANKAVQAYNAQHMITEDLMTMFKDVNKEVEVYNDNNNNRLILSGVPEEIDFALQQLEILDEVQNMITVEMMLIEYFHDDEFDWGFDIIAGKSGNFSNTNFAPGGGDELIGFNFQSLTKLVPEFHFNLQALVSHDKAKIVTNPHVSVEAGETATINLQDERNIQLETATINGVTTTIQSITAGIKMVVTPQMINENLIKLNVDGVISEFLPFSPSGEFIKEHNAINTTVDVRPGESLIIGGMIKEEYNTLEGGIPILKNIPLLGFLFKRKKRVKTYIERVLYVTPYLNAGNLASDYGIIRNHTNLEEQVTKMIEEDPNFLRYDKTKKSFKQKVDKLRRKK